MAVAITLVEHTPHRLRYQLVADGVAATWFITNNGVGPSPDLRLDAGNGINATNTLRTLVSQTIVAGSPSPAARRLLDGQGMLANGAGVPSEPRGHVTIVPAGPAGSPGWSVDEDEGTILDPASAGHAIITGTAPLVAGERALVTLEFDGYYR